MQFSQKKSNYLNDDKNAINNKYLPWVVCLISALFFLYEFIQINMFNSIDPYVMRTYALSSTGLGFLSSIYFYSTVAFLLPAGQILDKFSPKKVILLTMIICIVGITGFSITSNIIFAAICRFFEGIGSAFCFLGSFKIASSWFPKNKLTFITGIIITIGMLGGAIAQTPLTMLISKYGWREALLMDAFFGILILAAIFLFVQDKPKNIEEIRLYKKNSQYWEKMKCAYFNKNNWSCGLYTCLMNSPMVILGALWGSLYLEKIDHMSAQSSSVIISMIFMGCIAGSPVFGFLSSIMKNRRVLMFFGVALSAITTLAITFYVDITYVELMSLFFLLGFFSSSQVLGYPTAAQNGPAEISAMSASVVSFTTMSGYIILQPLFGFILDAVSKNEFNNGVYSTSAFHSALLLIPASIALAGISLIFVKEPNK